MQKKVLIYGENWVGTISQLINRELTSLGYLVTHFDFTDILPGVKNRSILQRIKRNAFFWVYTDKIQKDLCSLVSSQRPDVIIIVKGLNLNKEVLVKLKKCGSIIINWNPDDFFNVKNSNKPLVESIPYYDLIVSSRPHLFDKYKKYGANDLLFLDWYYVPDLHFDRGLPKTIPASFVGSWSASREEFIGRLNNSFKIWGGGWERSSVSFRRKHDVQNKILSQIEMSTVFNSSQFNLNLLTHENSDLSNLRFFEVPASGGLLLTERNRWANSNLVDRRECIMFSSAEEVNSVLSGKQCFELEKIARAGHRRIVSTNNTFSDRVASLLKYI